MHRALSYPSRFIRLAAALLAGAAITAMAAVPASAQEVAGAAEARDFAIAPQSLVDAMREYSRVTGIQVAYTAAVGSGVASPGVSGRLAPAEALSRLLVGTGLSFRFTGPNAVTLEAVPQAADGAVQLGPVRVEGSGVGASLTSDPIATEGTGSYASPRASLLKGTDALKDIPQSVTVITRQQIDDQRLDTLDDVLANTPGVTLVNRPNGGSDIYSRGFATTTIQYDGVPLQRGSSTGNHFAATSVHLDRVEVLRGAQGLLEGSGNPGGAVNVVRKRGLIDRAVRGEARAGSWNNFGGRIDVGGPIDAAGKFRVRAVVDYEDKDTFIDTISERNFAGYAAIDFVPGPDTTIGFGILHSKRTGARQLYYGLPRYSDGTEIDLPRSTYIGADWNDADRRETQVFADLEHRFSDNWSFKLSGAYVKEDFDAIMSFGGYLLVPVGGTTIEGHGYRYDFASENYGLDARVNGSFDAFGQTHDLVLGANFSRQERQDYFDEYWSYTVFDLFNIDRNPPRLETQTPNGLYDFTGWEEQTGLYGTLRLRPANGLSLILGGRVSWYDYRSRVRTLARTTINRREESGVFTPFVGLVYEVTPNLSLYASYADIFQPQSATNAQFEVLPPIVGANYEAGIKSEFLGGALNASLALFRIDQHNRAIPDLVSPPTCGSAGNSRCSRAAGKVRSEGVEFEMHGELARGWQLSGGYTYNKNKFLEDNVAVNIGAPFDYNSPRHILRLWSNYRLPGALDAVDIGLGVRYRSKQRTNSTTRLNPVQDAYSIWSARIGYRLDANWSASLNVENLFDKHYYSFVESGYIFSYVGEPRNVLLTLRGQF